MKNTLGFFRFCIYMGIYGILGQGWILEKEKWDFLYFFVVCMNHTFFTGTYIHRKIIIYIKKKNTLSYRYIYIIY